MRDYKIWILFSDTGGGHRSASQAIETAIKEVAVQEHMESRLELMVESIAEQSHLVNKVFVGLYNYLLRHHQDWMKYYYWFLHLTKPNSSNLGYWLIKPFLGKLLVREDPSVIVSVHPMLNHYLVRNRKELGLTDKVKLIEVITDPNKQLWEGWACKGMDLIIAPNDLARDQLVKWGIPPERIRILGMPINPKFLRPAPTTRAEFMNSLGLHPSKLTICLNAGWAGGGNLLKVYEKLSKVKRDIQVLFLCGRNEALLEKVNQAAKNSPVKTVALSFHEMMVDVMSHCDLMVTKAGGLTTFEAIAKRLPLVFDVITEPMPQESGTIEMLVSQGLCHAIKQPEDILPIVESLQPVADRESQPLPYMHNLNRTGASYDIAKITLAACEPSFDFLADTAMSSPIADNSYGAVWEASLGLEGT